MAFASSGFISDNARSRGKSVRIYGEFTWQSGVSRYRPSRGKLPAHHQRLQEKDARASGALLFVNSRCADYLASSSRSPLTTSTPCQRRRPLAVRRARQAAQIEPGALQRPRDRAALIACHSGDENRSIARHG
jgi:hypothetical protein